MQSRAVTSGRSNPAVHLIDIHETLNTALVGRYVLERELGRGGMATVYLARDLKHDRLVALKVLHPELAATLGPERFLREIRLTARLDHAHILPVLDSGEAAGQLWYTMPYVRGESLRDRLRREVQLPVEVAVDLTRQIASALDYAHREGVVHRDLKPENILVADGQARVADFGVAKAVAGSGDGMLTETGLAVGTPAYMSPEQASSGQVDGRSDIYALGCVLYETLIGEPPFTGPTAQALLARRLAMPAPRAGLLRDTVPPELDAALARALARTPADRYPSAAEFAAALEPALVPTSPVPRDNYPIPAKHPRSPWRALVATAGTALLLGLGAMSVWLWQPRNDPVLDSQRVAVAPFDALGPGLEPWREGLVDLLARKLDGFGALRTVAPIVIIRQWQGRADAESARHLGRRTGAGLVVFGQIISISRDSVRLSATLLDVARDRRLAEFDRAEALERLDRLTDSLAVGLARAYAGPAPSSALRLPSVGTGSFAALKAFVQGERLMRLSAWDSAAARYARAVELDTSFGLAWRRLASARGWAYDLAGADTLRQIGVRFNRGLAPRDSLLLLADSLDLARRFAVPSRAWATGVRRLETLEEATRHYPTDPEVWYQLAEARMHSLEAQVTAEDLRAGFERVIGLDSSFAPPYIHAAQLSLDLGRPTEAWDFANRYLRLTRGVPEGEMVRVFADLLDPRRAASPELRRVLDSLPLPVLWDIAEPLSALTDSAEVAVHLLRRYLARAGSSMEPERRYALANVLALRGHLREARAHLSDRLSVALIHLAHFNVLPSDTSIALIDRWLADSLSRATLHPADNDCDRDAAVTQWLGGRSDTTRLEALLRRSRDVGARSEHPKSHVRFAVEPALVRAGLQIARTDTSAALAELLAMPASACRVASEVAIWRARLLAARGRYREAAAELDLLRTAQRSAYWVAIKLERGMIAEHLGDRAGAVGAYRYVLNAWRRPDPQLRDFTEAARAHVQRLTGGE